MTWPIDVPELERAIVRHCSPTLAALKPASLFTFPGVFVAQDGIDEASATQRRQALLSAISFCKNQIVDAGLDICVLSWKSCGALVYVYRPQTLTRFIADPRAAATLSAVGYRTEDLSSCLELLGNRLSRKTLNAETARSAAPCPRKKTSCTREFPHEIGFFLGYPYEDVLGFIKNRGKNYVAVGPWKVYENKERALATFERYHSCSKAYARAYRHGCRLARLAIRTRAITR